MEGYRLKRGNTPHISGIISFDTNTIKEIHLYFKRYFPIHEYHICRARRKLLKIS